MNAVLPSLGLSVIRDPIERLDQGWTARLCPNQERARRDENDENQLHVGTMS